MPQLNKGGKFVFGFSVMRDDLTIHIPPQALHITRRRKPRCPLPKSSGNPSMLFSQGIAREALLHLLGCFQRRIGRVLCYDLPASVRFKVKTYFRGLPCIKRLSAFRG